MIDKREFSTVPMLDENSLLTQLEVNPEKLYKRVMEPILDSSLAGVTHAEKILDMIQNHDILPNEMAFLIANGVEYICMKMERDMEAEQ